MNPKHILPASGETTETAKIAESIMMTGLKKELKDSRHELQVALDMVAALRVQLSALRQDQQYALASLNAANRENTRLKSVLEMGHKPFPCWVLGLSHFCERARVPQANYARTAHS